jgi:hypothetical protein
LCLSDFNQTWFFNRFSKLLEYQISLKSVQLKPSCSKGKNKREDRQKDIHTWQSWEALFTVFRTRLIMVTVPPNRETKGADVRKYSAFSANKRRKGNNINCCGCGVALCQNPCSGKYLTKKNYQKCKENFHIFQHIYTKISFKPLFKFLIAFL